jgi:hypothetical protein
MQRRDLIECTMMLNKEVDWQQLGFVCDGRFIFTQRSLQTCLLPDKFARYFPRISHDLHRTTRCRWQKNNSLLCVGLDPDPAKFPAQLKAATTPSSNSARPSSTPRLTWSAPSSRRSPTSPPAAPKTNWKR